MWHSGGGQEDLPLCFDAALNPQTSILRAAPWPNCSRRWRSSTSWKRVSMYSLAKELGTEMVRAPSSRLTGEIPSNQTFREEESISAAVASSVSRHGPSAEGSGVGLGGGESLARAASGEPSERPDSGS